MPCTGHTGSQGWSIVCRVISSAGGSAFGSVWGRCRWAGRVGRWPEGLSGDLKPLPIIQSLSSNVTWKCLAGAAGGGRAVPVPRPHTPAPAVLHGLPIKLTRGAWLDVLPCMVMLSITYISSSHAMDGDMRMGTWAVPPAGRRPGPCSHCARHRTSPQQGQLPPSRAWGMGSVPSHQP